MPYDCDRNEPKQPPTDARLKPKHADMGVDEVSRNPDGSVTAIQYKRTSHDPGTSVRMQPRDALVDCPECAGLHGPAHGRLSASNLTAAASGAYFGDLNPANIIVGDIHPAEIVLIDCGVYDGSSTVDLREVLHGLTPDPENQVFVVTHPDTDHLPSAGLTGSAVLDSVDTGKVVRLLKHWSRVSRSDPPPSLLFETLAINLTRRLVSGSARCAVRAAYLARDAIVHGGTEASRPAVARFAETWGRCNLAGPADALVNNRTGTTWRNGMCRRACAATEPVRPAQPEREGCRCSQVSTAPSAMDLPVDKLDQAAHAR